MRCGKCKHQWHATPPLITLPADDITLTKRSEKPDDASDVAVTAGIAQNSISGSTVSEPPKSSFTQTTFDEEEAMSALPAFSSDMAPIAKRNAIIAAVLLASLLSIPLFMINHGGDKAPEQPSEHTSETASHGEEAKSTLAKAELKKEEREIILDGTPTTLLKEEVGRTILSIEGALINKTNKTLPVPVLQAQALNAKGKVVKEWIIPIGPKEMDPGQRQPFSYSMPFAEQGVVDIAFHFL